MQEVGIRRAILEIGYHRQKDEMTNFEYVMFETPERHPSVDDK